jgi:hypothetical protein
LFSNVWLPEKWSTTDLHGAGILWGMQAVQTVSGLFKPSATTQVVEAPMDALQPAPKPKIPVRVGRQPSTQSATT